MNGDLEDFYNQSVSQIIQFITQFRESESSLCCYRVLESSNEQAVILTWVDYEKIYKLLGVLFNDLKTVIMTRMARDTNYSLDKIITETKRFMSHDDYISTLEKLIHLRLEGPDAYYDICSCNKCY